MSCLISVIVSTYNWPQAIRNVLQSLREQSDRHFEVIIADDGSTGTTADLITSYGRQVPFAVRHYWQEDQGYRLARVRNGAVARSQGEYLLFLDGDCCVLPDFIVSHRRLMERGWFVSGKRCFLRKRVSDSILAGKTVHDVWSRKQWLFRAFLGGSTRPFEFLPLPLGEGWRKKRARRWQGVQTCHLGVWKDDFLAVDGFDMSYENHGFEDSDFVLRLIRAGIFRKRGDHTSPVLHLHHPRPSQRPDDPAYTDAKGENQTRFARLLADSSRIKPVIGYSALP